MKKMRLYVVGFLMITLVAGCSKSQENIQPSPSSTSQPVRTPNPPTQKTSSSSSPHSYDADDRAAMYAASDAANKKAADQKAFDERLRRPPSSFDAGPEARKERNSDWIIRRPASPAE